MRTFVSGAICVATYLTTWYRAAITQENYENELNKLFVEFLPMQETMSVEDYALWRTFLCDKQKYTNNQFPVNIYSLKKQGLIRFRVNDEDFVVLEPNILEKLLISFKAAIDDDAEAAKVLIYQTEFVDMIRQALNLKQEDKICLGLDLHSLEPEKIYLEAIARSGASKQSLEAEFSKIKEMKLDLFKAAISLDPVKANYFVSLTRVSQKI